MGDSSKNPGPGTYVSSLTDKRNAPKFAFGNGQREKMGGSVVAVPGPGTYAIPGIVGNDGRANGIHNKIDYDKIYNKNRNPGPGAYDSSLSYKKKAPAYGLGHEKRSGMANNNNSPSPDRYNPSDSYTAKKGAQWGFGHE